MNKRRIERFRAITTVGRQFTHMVYAQGKIETALQSLKSVASGEQQSIVSNLEAAFSEQASSAPDALSPQIGPYSALRKLVAVVRKEGGDPIAVFPRFDAMLLSLDEHIRQMWSSIESFLIYFLTVVIIAAIVFGELFVFVVPQYQAMFSSFGHSLPTLTDWLTKNNGIFAVLLIGGLGFVFAILIISGKRVFDNISNLLPVASFVQNIAFLKPIANSYNRILSLNYTRVLIGAGLSFKRALELSAQLANDEVFAAEILTSNTSGKSIAVKSKRNKQGNHVASAIALAQAAGNLEAELDYQISDLNVCLAHQLMVMRDKVMTLLHVLLAVIIGLLVVAMYLPIFKLGELG